MRYVLVGESLTGKALRNEGMYAVRDNASKSARFVQVKHSGKMCGCSWGAAFLLAEVTMYYSTRAGEYVLTNTTYATGDEERVLLRGDSYECALFIARRARAFGFQIYATDVPMDSLEANDAEEC